MNSCSSLPRILCAQTIQPMMNDMSLHPYPKGAPTGCQISIEGDILRVVAAITNLPSPTLHDSPFIRALGTPAAQRAPPQTCTLAQRALEEWERTLCENKAVAILAQMQAGCENSGLQPLAASLANAKPTRWGPSLSGDADE